MIGRNCHFLLKKPAQVRSERNTPQGELCWLISPLGILANSPIGESMIVAKTTQLPSSRLGEKIERGISQSRYSNIGTFDEKGLAILSGTFHHSAPFGCPPNSQRTTFFDADVLQRAPRSRSLLMRDARRDGRRSRTPHLFASRSPVRFVQSFVHRLGLGLEDRVAARNSVKPEHSGRYPTQWVGIALENRGIL